MRTVEFQGVRPRASRTEAGSGRTRQPTLHCAMCPLPAFWKEPRPSPPAPTSPHLPPTFPHVLSTSSLSPHLSPTLLQSNAPFPRSPPPASCLPSPGLCAQPQELATGTGSSACLYPLPRPTLTLVWAGICFLERVSRGLWTLKGAHTSLEDPGVRLCSCLLQTKFSPLEKQLWLLPEPKGGHLR